VPCFSVPDRSVKRRRVIERGGEVACDLPAPYGWSVYLTPDGAPFAVSDTAPTSSEKPRT
jgi:hypothetical protein